MHSHTQNIKSIVTAALCIILFICYDVSAQQLAFPGAEGFGKFTSGGRGGDVYVVSNLNNSGPGSLREAIDVNGPRTIVFSISGTIHLTEELVIRNDDISIFGQTAPGDGIAIGGHGSRIAADNVIIQHIRFRPGDVSGNEYDALWGRQNKDIILDHLSLSWSTDEAGSFYDNENFTLQWSILSESLYNSVHDKGTHGYGGIWGGMGATFHHNLLAHHTSRNPRFNGARYTSTPETELVDFRNNVIFNWGGNSAYAGEEGNHNVVANYYKAGPATKSNRDRILDARAHSSGFDLGKWYLTNNYVHGFPEITEDNWNGGVQRVSQDEIEYIRMDEPFEAPALESFETAEEAFENVLANAGAILPRRDTIDSRIVEEVHTGTATYGGTYGSGLGIIDSQDEVGGWPELFSATAPTDTDGDGIPDEWEIENGLDPEDASDSRDISDSGYSYLELYVHSLGEQGEFTPAPGVLSLHSPVNKNQVSVTPTFIWSVSSFADEYEIQITNGTYVGADIIFDAVVDDTTTTLPQEYALNGSTTYFWRVRGLNDAGSGTWSNFAYFETEVSTSIDGNDPKPSSFKLAQNYPNPFNPSTNIEFTLPVSSNVELRVFDITGREVAELVNGQRTSGNHTIQFNASELSSGVYVYMLKAVALNGDHSQSILITRKMSLIK